MNQRKLSPVRVVLAILALAGLVSGAFQLTKLWKTNRSSANFQPWFASYVDATATPSYEFEKLGAVSNSNVVLSFIVSSPEDICTPTWGTFYTLDEAAGSLDLDRRIARLQQQGGKIAVSFGGAINDELSLKCTDPEKLAAAYALVIDRYKINTIDLDLENAGLSDREAGRRRAKAIAGLQKLYQQRGHELAIWLTLPVAPSGMTDDGLHAISEMLDEGVDLTGVNLMTMNYSASRTTGQSMFEASRLSLVSAQRQLGILYKQAGINISGKSLWQKIGATPMIGQNDIADEVFTILDARELNKFALETGLGRMSLWSANRDVKCGENYVNVKIVSDSCSGVTEDQYAFINTLSAGFSGDPTQQSSILPQAAEEVIVDDPKTSPYQIWQEIGTYPQGTKVVWHGNVYVAKWWTKGNLPDHPVLREWETPWQLVGPVLPGDRPITQPILPSGTYPAWSGTQIYLAGQRVLFDGIPFQAKWWNQGQSPAVSAVNPDNSPWLPLSQAEIKAILEESDK